MAKAPLDLTSGPIGRNLLLFSLPILAGNIAQSLNGSVNAVWVGRFLGEAALTATANANNIMFFLIGSVFGFGMASTILIGQAIGARDIAQARRVVSRSCWRSAGFLRRSALPWRFMNGKSSAHHARPITGT